jgi:hypothetical protein
MADHPSLALPTADPKAGAVRSVGLIKSRISGGRSDKRCASGLGARLEDGGAADFAASNDAGDGSTSAPEIASTTCRVTPHRKSRVCRSLVRMPAAGRIPALLPRANRHRGLASNRLRRSARAGFRNINFHSSRRRCPRRGRPADALSRRLDVVPSLPLAGGGYQLVTHPTRALARDAGFSLMRIVEAPLLLHRD